MGKRVTVDALFSGNWLPRVIDRTCECVTCEKPLHPLGVARHRAMHRDNKEDCIIETSDGATRTYRFSNMK